jgi:hypothetical protein
MLATSEIKFPKFRENRDEYIQSRREWLEVFNAALKPINQAGWEDWLRDPFFEGTPIFSRVNRHIKTGKPQGIVINQILPSDDDLSFRAYLDIFADDSDVDLVEHVVITSTLTEQSKEKSRKLINKYLVDKLPPGEIERLCEALTYGSVDTN